MTITPELKQAVALADGSPVRLEDPETDEVYLVTKQVREDPDSNARMPEGVRLAFEAFRRDLPAMQADRRFTNKAVLYHRDKRIAVGKNESKLYRRAVRKGIPTDDFCIFDVIPPRTPPTSEEIARANEPRPAPEGIRLACEAFERDLPAMMADKKLKEKWVLYHRDKRIAVGKRGHDLGVKAVAMGIADGDFMVFYVAPIQTDFSISSDFK